MRMSKRLVGVALFGVFLASMGVGYVWSQTSTATCQGAGSNTANCMLQGGARLVIGGIQDVVSGGSLHVKSGGSLVIDTGATVSTGMVATQTIAAGGTIAADSCGASIKRVTAAGAVTTSTTNTFTAPAAANSGCHMMICNVGAQTITLDKNALTLLQGGADVALLASSCVGVASDGAIWRQTSAQQTST
jgi:hypothetical protein